MKATEPRDQWRAGLVSPRPQARLFAYVTIPAHKRTSALIVLLLILATVAVFWKVPAADFVQWDDDINIYRNPYHGRLSWERLVWMFTDIHYVLYYAPLSWLTLSIIYEFSGLNPIGYHVASLLLHCANAM